MVEMRSLLKRLISAEEPLRGFRTMRMGLPLVVGAIRFTVELNTFLISAMHLEMGVNGSDDDDDDDAMDDDDDDDDMSIFSDDDVRSSSLLVEEGPEEAMAEADAEEGPEAGADPDPSAAAPPPPTLLSSL